MSHLRHCTTFINIPVNVSTSSIDLPLADHWLPPFGLFNQLLNEQIRFLCFLIHQIDVINDSDICTEILKICNVIPRKFCSFHFRVHPGGESRYLWSVIFDLCPSAKVNWALLTHIQIFFGQLFRMQLLPSITELAILTVLLCWRLTSWNLDVLKGYDMTYSC